MPKREEKKAGRTTQRPAGMLPKVIGYDAEVGNFISGQDGDRDTAKEASRAIIREIRGHAGRDRGRLADCGCDECESDRRAAQRNASRGYYSTVERDGTVTVYVGPGAYGDALHGDAVNGEAGDRDEGVRDHDRIFLPENGGCVYIDLDHVELCLPETLSAFDYVACWHAALRILRRALDSANLKLSGGERIHVLVNNSDGEGHSYGSHLNLLISERTRQNIFERRMQYLLYLAAYQVSSIIFTGQGKVSCEEGARDVDYQLSQRADFFEQIVGPQTTHARPIVNSRDEALCGTYEYRRRNTERDGGGLARLHVIFFDSTLCQVSTLLKAGVMQIILAMIEAERVNPRLILDDPVAAVKTWSRDTDLRSKMTMCSGRRVTALELQFMFLEEAMRFAGRGGLDGIVPRAAEILDLWADTLDKLRTRDLASLSRRLDWALKLSLLEGLRHDRKDIHWKHPVMKQLDHLYSSLDPEEGLFWTFDAENVVDRVVSEADIARFVSNPPEDTRAWTRAKLLQWAGPQRTAGIDWDYVRCVVRDEFGCLQHRNVDLADPLGFTRKHSKAIFKEGAPLDAVVRALEARASIGSRHANAGYSDESDTDAKAVSELLGADDTNAPAVWKRPGQNDRRH